MLHYFAICMFTIWCPQCRQGHAPPKLLQSVAQPCRCGTFAPTWYPKSLWVISLIKNHILNTFKYNIYIYTYQKITNTNRGILGFLVGPISHDCAEILSFGINFADLRTQVWSKGLNFEWFGNQIWKWQGHDHSRACHFERLLVPWKLPEGTIIRWAGSTTVSWSLTMLYVTTLSHVFLLEENLGYKAGGFMWFGHLFFFCGYRPYVTSRPKRLLRPAHSFDMFSLGVLWCLGANFASFRGVLLFATDETEEYPLVI